MADDQVTIDPEFDAHPDSGRGRWLWLAPVAAAVVAAFLFGWLLGTGTSDGPDVVEAAASTSTTPFIETTSTTDPLAATSTTTVSPSTTEPPATRSTTEPPSPLAHEVLLDRSHFSGFMVPFCADPTLMLSEDPWKLTATSPLIELRDGSVAARSDADGSFLKVVYADDDAVVAAAFDRLVAELEVCLDTPNPTAMLVPEYVEDGWHWVADRYELPPTGDEAYAISYTAQDGDGAAARPHADMRLAIVRSGDRIMLITQGSPIGLGAALTDSEFNEIVQVATNRLTP